MKTIAPLTCSKRGCDHFEHRLARAKYELNRRRQIAYGRWEPFVDAEPARQHVKWLMEQGVPFTSILPVYPNVAALLYGRPAIGQPPTEKIRPEAEQALLAIQPTLDTLGDHARIDAAGTHRRMQALCALGWPLKEQARRLNTGPHPLRQALKEETVTVRFFRRIQALYGELSMVRPEGWVADKIRRQAEEKGWLPPLAWDDDLIDLPDADLQAELSRRTAAMDSAELHRCYRASLEGDRSPLIVAAAEEYLARRREKRTKTTAA
ncbi:hypothetical protein [Nocardiopsis dassonvillei]|uniref:hypothetical protein n=1 Tax=Nocardiopsis dassonvillei TaxID=2014 RepID=UPI00157BE2F5|nr:hypothetical protein [Nocardiopsis dassonvillei]